MSDPQAPVVVAVPGRRPAELLAAVGLAADRPRPVIVVCGGAGELAEPQLSQARAVLGPAVGYAARKTGAAVVDGGTDAGVMALMGEERAASGLSVLLGVAPAGRVALPGAEPDGRVALEPHHSHFVLDEGAEWGDETELLMGLAEALADGPRVAVVVAGGGSVTGAEVREALARGWPVFAIAGTGGAADELAAQLRVLPAGDPQQAARELIWQLHDDDTLKDAWALFATYDGLAGRLRSRYERLQASILLVGILATLLALLHDALGGAALHWAVVVAPILAAVLIALGNRLAAGKRWVLLRAAAEAIKSEIYRYRTATGTYAEAAGRRQQLAAQLADIEEKLLQTEAGSGALPAYDGPLPPRMYGAAAADDGLSPLDAGEYVAIRLNDQLAYYRGKTSALDRRRIAFNLITVAAGGAGAILAAAGQEIWIGLTTAITGAALAHLGYLQVENTIVAYNQSAGRLAALERDYRARRAGAEPIGLHDLVTRGEAVLTTELAGWVQQMTEAMREQQRRQAEAEKTIEPKPDQPAQPGG